jgi:hypothetical protein
MQTAATAANQNETVILVSLTVFDDRVLMTWSSMVDGVSSPIQHIGRVDDERWREMFGRILETDRVRVVVTDRRDSSEAAILDRMRKSHTGADWFFITNHLTGRRVLVSVPHD